MLEVMRLIFVLFFTFIPWLTAAAPSQPSSQSSEPRAIHLLFIGDSITDGYGVKRSESYPSVIERKLQSAGKRVKVTNAGVSGSVSADSDRRLQWQLRAKPDVLILALGGNDALKGTPVEAIKNNLGKTIDLAKKNNVKVLLAGIKVFSNFGDEYNNALEKMYKDLAREKKVPLLPFLLEGVALDKTLMLPDAKHPNAKGQEKVAELVLKALEPLL